MNIIDSSCWLEYFAGSRTGKIVAPVIQDQRNLVVPSIVIYEVFKKLLSEVGEDRALYAIAHLKQAAVIELDSTLSIYSAYIGKEYKLPMADSIIYATTLRTNAILWTQDSHFQDLKSVKYINKE